MVGQRKMFRWSKEQMVDNANLFAREVLGRSETPPLQRDLVNTLGLQGIAALNVVDGPSAEEVAAQEALEEEAAEETVVVKVNKKEIGLGLMKDAKKASDAIMALDPAAALALQATLDEKGQAEVAGFTILKDMVTVKKVKKGLKRSGSTSSMASSTSGALSRSGSALSLSSAASGGGALSRNGSALSLCSADSGDGGESKPALVIPKALPFKADPEAVKAAVARVGAAGAAMSSIMNAVKAEGGNVKTDARVVAASEEMALAKAALTEVKTGKVAS